MHLSPLQRKFLVGYLICVLISCIYVPWEAGPLNPNTGRIPAGYALIFNPPVYYEYHKGYAYNPFTDQSTQDIRRFHITGINSKVLITEIAGITCIFGLLYLLKTINNKNSGNNSEKK